MGRRKERVERFLDTLTSFSSNPNNKDRNKILPNYTPAYGDQLKRGFKPQRNAACVCGSGKKYKHCHMELEEVTPYLAYDGYKPRVVDPVEEAKRLEELAEQDFTRNITSG